MALQAYFTHSEPSQSLDGQKREKHTPDHPQADIGSNDPSGLKPQVNNKQFRERVFLTIQQFRGLGTGLNHSTI